MMKKIFLGFIASLFLLTSAQAADFKWMNNKGELFSLSEAYQGQPIVVHFWASWCPPCVAEMPEMSAWLKEHPEVKVLPVSLDNDLETAQVFLQQHHINLPALLTDSSQSGRMGVRGLPTTILIDEHGKVITGRIGMQNWQQKSWTNQLLELFSREHIQNIGEIAHAEHN
ncbi:MAG: TlpA disulfide reductase family protein [Mariprofundaceae bacterium]|nr:TlpA disulfide reductase family protein [Mariprofundaceae bacterium]